VSGAILNIVLDPILIFVCNMGVAGAALATITSQILSFCILLAMSRKEGNIHIRFKNFRPNAGYMLEILNGGLPSLFRQGLGSLAQVCMNHAAGTYGGIYSDAAIAGMSIVNRVMMFANSALIGFGQGFQPVCGMNYGGKKYERVREGFFFCVKYATIFLTVVAALLFIFAGPIITIFRKDDADVVRIGMLAMRFQCIAMPLNAFIVMSNMMLQSVGKAVRASILAAARQGLFFIPFILILPLFTGLLGVQMSQMCSDICSFCVALPLAFSFLREMRRAAK
jgi:Na+-driven multidrug efflux pump